MAFLEKLPAKEQSRCVYFSSPSRVLALRRHRSAREAAAAAATTAAPTDAPADAPAEGGAAAPADDSMQTD